MSAAILAIDASTEACSVALQVNNATAHRFELCPQQHSQRILPMVDEVLNELNVKLGELDAIAFGCGPGSFTGVRISIGVAQGLAFGADLPMVGISTLEAMAYGAVSRFGQTKVVAAIDARMGEIYTAEFAAEQGNFCRLSNDAVVAPEQAQFSLDADICAVGTGWQTYGEQLKTAFSSVGDVGILYPDAQDMLPLAQKALAQGLQVSAEQAQPVYVRDTVTWKKLPGRE